MSEILTESFCERCGTRYTFETEAPRAKRFGKFKVLSKGLKNYVLSDESSLDEALADARSDEDRQASGEQLDAFHKTFNFCMSCRQYTCANCWNEVESRCLSCAPHLGHEVLDATFRTPDPFGRIASIGAAAAGNGHELDLETILQGSSTEAAWPTADIGRTPAAEDAPEDTEADAVSRLESLFAIATRPDEPARDTAPKATTPAKADEAATTPAKADAAAQIPAKADAAAQIPAKPADVGATTPAKADAATITPAKPADAPAPARPAKPVRDIALEVSLFEEDAAQFHAEASAPPSAPSPAPTAVPQPVAADGGQAETVASEDDTLDERTAAALSQTADFLTRFRTLAGIPVASPMEPAKPAAAPEPVAAAAPAPEPVAETAPAPEPVVEAAPLPEPEPTMPVQPPVAADAVRPQVDRIEFPTWHINTPAPAGPNGRPSEPALIPTSPGPALQPSAQARWPAPETPTTPSFPVPPPAPAPTIQPQASQPPAVLPPVMPPAAMPPAAMPPTAMPPAAQPQWPEAASWPVNQPRAAAKGVDAMWAASSRDVLSRADSGVQSCVNCGLPLSATARFCRRCGANQVPT